MTCHFFRHHPGPECIPLLTCHLHQGLIAHGEHLTHRCSTCRPTLWIRWSQRLDVTSGELLPDQPVPLL